MIEAALFSRLTADAGISALVAARVYPVKAPQGTPASFIVYRRVSGERWRSLDGATGVARPRFQLDAYGSTYDEARNLAGAIRVALDDWSDPDAGILACDLDNEIDLIDTEAEPILYRVTLDFFITHRE